MSILREVICGSPLPVFAMQSGYAWSDVVQSFFGLAAYTAAVFVLGYLTARARWAAQLASTNDPVLAMRDAETSSRECENLLAEIRQEIDAHSDSAQRLDEQLDSSNHDSIRRQANETRLENSEFRAFLDESFKQLKLYAPGRSSTLKNFLTSMAGHRRRANNLDVVLEQFVKRDEFDSEISPLRECIRDLQNHNRRLQAELDETREAIAQQSQQLEQAQELARVDSLTKLPNRRAFDEKIGELHALFDRGNSPYVVALLDIDHFKKFNDEHGHAIGDKVLEFVADILRGTQRWTDLVARYGGEEFVVLLPRVTGHKAKFVIDRQRAKVEHAMLTIGGQALSVTLSAGVAEVLPGDTVSSVLARADAALYAAKAAGRNQTCLEDDGKIVEVSQLRLTEEAAEISFA